MKSKSKFVFAFTTLLMSFEFKVGLVYFKMFGKLETVEKGYVALCITFSVLC